MEPRVYEIRIRGDLGQQWADWFEGFSIRSEGCGVTVLVGPLVDQAALYGLLGKLRDLGLEVLSLNPEEGGIR